MGNPPRSAAAWGLVAESVGGARPWVREGLIVPQLAVSETACGT